MGIQERILEYYDEGKMKKIHCLNTSNITKMNYLLSSYDNFGGDVRFRFFNTDLSCWNVSSVTRMAEMFYSASSFNNDVSSWDVSSVTSMSRIFKDATVFGMRLCNWNLENVVDMDELFDGSNCDFRRCLNCTYGPTSSPSFTLLSSSPSSSSSYTPTYRNITLFPIKASSSSSVPTLSPTTKKRK